MASAKRCVALVQQLLDEAHAEGFPPGEAELGHWPGPARAAWEVAPEPGVIVRLAGELITILPLNEHPSEADRIVDLAWILQDFIVEYDWVHYEPIWPACVKHPHTHPLTACVVDGLAVWICPRNKSVIRPIEG